MVLMLVHLKLDDYITSSRSMLMVRVDCSLYLYNVATTQLVRYIIIQLYTSVFVTNIKFHMKKVLHIEVTRLKQNGFRAGRRPKQNGFRAGQRHNVNMFNKSKQTFPTNYGPQHNWDTIIQKYQQSSLFSCTHGAQVLTHHCIQIQRRILGTPNLLKQIT